MPQTATVDDYAFATAESAPNDEFKTVSLAGAADIVPIRAVFARPATANESLETLHDGRLAANYGPVFPNKTELGLYKVDLGTAREVAAVGTWSTSQNGNRGAQHFTLFGSSADQDPGWDVVDAQRFIPLAQVDSRSAERFHATRVQSSSDKTLGCYRWLVWAVQPVTKIGEHTAFQEFRVW